MLRNPGCTARMLLTALCVSALGACATMTPAEQRATCQSTDWERYGMNDGTLGVPTAARIDVFEDCAAVGAPVQLAAYQTGRTEGLKTYCTAPSGFQVGYDGRRYRDVCPPALEPDFLQGFRRGRAERPAYLRHGFGIGIGSSGIRTGIGIRLGTL
ncbi:MAG: DUF2799 domain-containing protein, partial [Pseudomonadota bacterium]